MEVRREGGGWRERWRRKGDIVERGGRGGERRICKWLYKRKLGSKC